MELASTRSLGEQKSSRLGRKPGFTRAEIADAALEIADRDGLAAVSFRRLALRLGVSPMAPYSYFESKADLLDAMVGRALAKLISEQDSSAPWDQQLAQAMRDVRAVLTEHPTIVELITTHYIEEEQLDEFREHLFAIMRQTGLGRQEGADILRVLNDYVLGSVVTRIRRGRVRRESDYAFELGLEMLMDSLRARVNKAA